MSLPRVLQLDPGDTVLVALENLRAGVCVSHGARKVALTSDVPAKHKFALDAIAAGSPVLMYGIQIGRATQDIRAGEIISTRNVHHEAASYQGKKQEYIWSSPDTSRWSERTFAGFLRDDGQVGTRNYWLVVPLVFCENRNIAMLKHAFEEELGFAQPPLYQQQVAEYVRLY